MWFLKSLACCLVVCAVGCVKAPIKPNQQLCAMAQSNVQQRLGPEFRRVLAAKLLFDDRNGTYGCGIVYERVDEELAEEFTETREGSSGDNHLVAFVSRVDGQPARFLDVRRSRMAPGPVSVKLTLAEVTGDEFLDLFILERAPQKGSLVDYQALKIINGDPFFTTEIFETTLLVESGDGTEFIASWSVDRSGAKPKLVIQGGPISKSYSYSSSSRRLLSAENSLKSSAKAPEPTSETSVQSTEGSNAFDANDVDGLSPSPDEK